MSRRYGFSQSRITLNEGGKKTINEEEKLIHSVLTQWGGEAQIEGSTRDIQVDTSINHQHGEEITHIPSNTTNLPQHNESDHYEVISQQPLFIHSHWHVFQRIITASLSTLQFLPYSLCTFGFDFKARSSIYPSLNLMDLRLLSAPLATSKEDASDKHSNGNKNTTPDEPSAAIRQSMDRSEYASTQRQVTQKPETPCPTQTVYIGLGSNVGDRLAAIEAACRMMIDHNIDVIRTSHLYETEPMYIKDQQRFLNSVCQVCVTQLRQFVNA